MDAPFRADRCATADEALQQNVDRSAGATGCWPWMAGKFSDGYGTVFDNGRNRRAHIVAWERSHGTSVPTGLLICHTCDNPLCCNPAHLYAGTLLDNARDKVERGRQPRGEQIKSAKVTRDQVLAIRVDSRPQRTIAADYDVSQATISAIKLGKTWSHV